MNWFRLKKNRLTIILLLPILLGMNSCAITNEVVFENKIEKSHDNYLQSEITTSINSQREFDSFRPLYLYVHSCEKYGIDLRLFGDSLQLVDKVLLRKVLFTLNSDTLFYKTNYNYSLVLKEDNKEYSEYSTLDSIDFSKRNPKHFTFNYCCEIYFKNGIVKNVIGSAEIYKKRYFAIYPLIAFTYGG